MEVRIKSGFMIVRKEWIVCEEIKRKKDYEASKIRQAQE